MTIVWEYGLRMPTENVSLIEDQLWEAQKYNNKLVELERKRREKEKKFFLGFPEFNALYQTASRLKEVREKLRKKRNGKKPSKKEQEARKAASTAYYNSLASLREKEKEMREDKGIKAVLEQYVVTCCKEERNVGSGGERGKTECYWGTYLLVEGAVDAASKAKRDIAVSHELEHGPVPRFRRWRREGLLGVQFQPRKRKGKSAYFYTEDALNGSDSRFQIGAIDPTAWDAGRSPKQRTCVRLCVKTEKRKPLFGVWPLYMHRPLPKGAKIVKAVIVRRMRAQRPIWKLQLTLEPPEGYRTGECGNGIVCLDIGWRRIEGDQTMRVAYWQDEHGNQEEVRMDPRTYSGFVKVEKLQGTRDKLFNELKETLYAWAKAIRPPEWLWDILRYLPKAKSQERYHNLHRAWGRDRWENDEAGWALLNTWVHRDRHLWQWQANLRSKLQNRRSQDYKLLGKRLAERYDTLVFTNFDLRETQKKPKDEDLEPGEHKKRWQQNKANCSDLRDRVINAFKARGGQVFHVDPHLVTRTCRFCSHAGEWENPEELVHTCAKCGESWDRDTNSTHNMFTRFHAFVSAVDVSADAVLDRRRRAKAAKKLKKKGEKKKVKTDFERYGCERLDVKEKQAKWAALGMHGEGARKRAAKSAE